MKNYVWENNSPEKNNFIARIIGIIGEEITSHWLANPQCDFENYGRPTIYWTEAGKKKQATLDFLIKKKIPNKEEFYIVEQKNFFAFQNGRLRTIDSSDDFNTKFKAWSDKKSQSTPAWQIFNTFKNFDFTVKTKNGEIKKDKVKGAILIWSDVNVQASNNLKKQYGYEDVIGVTRMVDDLIKWNDSNWSNYIKEKTTLSIRLCK